MICVGVLVRPLAAPVAILEVAVEVHVQQVDAAIGDAADRACGCSCVLLSRPLLPAEAKGCRVVQSEVTALQLE